MINYKWEILHVFTKEELITGVKYRLIGKDEKKSIETEGTVFFADPELKVRFLDVTELMIVEWLEKETFRDGKSHVKSGIERQFNALELEEVIPPWMPQMFTVGN